jgi:hypothetical protein
VPSDEPKPVADDIVVAEVVTEKMPQSKNRREESKVTMSKRTWIIVGVVASCLMIGGCCVVSTAAYFIGRGTTNSSERSLDPDKEQFLDLVRKNAQDPTGLEILEWGQRGKMKWGKGEEDARHVKFRCKLVGLTKPRDSQLDPRGPVQVDKGGAPVMLETGIIFYNGDKIERVFCNNSSDWWNP